jgi:uncharacterized membrane protein
VQSSSWVKEIEMNIRRLKARTLALIGLWSQSWLAIAQPACPQPSQWDCPAQWHMWSGGMGWWWVFPLLFMLLMIGACAGLMYFIGHRSGSGHHFGPWHMMGSGRSWGDPAYAALQVLNERFARGEIAKQEYEDKKASLLSGR